MATTITANGINFPDGSAGTPSIGGSDTNTGLFTGSDIVGFATGGSERLKIDASGNVNIANDSGKLRLGASNDLQLYHDGTNSYIQNSTGDLKYKAAAQQFIGSNDENMIIANQNGAVELYHNNSKKFETTATGATVSGAIIVNSSVTATDLSTFSAGLKTGTDDQKLVVGASDDLEIWHSSNSNSYIKNSTGELKLASANIALMNTDQSEKFIQCTGNGAVELYHDNVKHFETTSIGCKLFDNDTTAALQFANSAGDNGYVMAESTNIIGFKDSQAHWLVKGFKDAAVELYYNNTLMLATVSNGIKLHSGGSSAVEFYDVNTSTIMMYTHSVNLRWYDHVNDDNIMQLSQNGDLNIDGSYSNSGVDYAEYFESTDGSAIAIGTTVVLEDGKVRAATSSETPIGVIRPKTSGTSVTGGVNQLNWQGKYLVDDYDGQIMESAVHCTWTDDNEVNQQCWKDRPPTGVTIPSDAVETTRERPKLNPLFDESKTYVPRSERDEWNCVGLLGQIPITKGQPTSSSWIKMKDKNSTVELWMVK